MTDPRNLRVRKCECSECIPVRTGRTDPPQDDLGSAPEWRLDEDEPRDWSRAGRTPVAMPLRSRIWGLDR